MGRTILSYPKSKLENIQRMAFIHNNAFLSLVFLLLFLVGRSQADAPSPHHIDLVKRSSFSKGFIFGSASSAYQVTSLLH